MERVPMRGRPGTTALPLTNARAVGGPIPLGLAASFFALALAGWLAAALALLWAAPDLAARDPLAPHAVLATHLVALGFLPFAVTGASFHLLPVMLRNDVHRPRLLPPAAALLCGGFLVAPGVAYHRPALLWPGAVLLALGLAIVVAEVVSLVLGAPRGRTLVASRVGVALSVTHVVAAFAAGAFLFDRGWRPVGGVTLDRSLLVHLHLAAIGWLALLILAVGRTLAPMLALAPTAPARTFPREELLLTAGLWLLIAGLLAHARVLTLAGGVVIVAALALFAPVVVRAGRTRRGPLEAPLAHMLAGVAFLVQAAVLGFAIELGLVRGWTGVVPYVVLLLLGWGAGTTLGHVGKLLSLSLWVWWPPGPRPKQEALYARRLGLVESACFAAGVEVVAVGALVTSVWTVRVGAIGLVASALLAAAGAWLTWSRRARLGAEQDLERGA